MFSPEEIQIAPSDSVRWPLDDGGDHAIVQTVPGNRTCNNLEGGFNSGRKTKGQAYQRTFPVTGVVNYKDGIGANCLKGAMGTIYVGTGPSGGAGGGAVPTGSASAAPIVAPSAPPSPTHVPSAASGFLMPQSSLILGAACFIGALAL
ncbi:hypothetical protein BGX34_011075 [Mortierella sp. NVP85]|nr:hypothetical protein BGX34_011075 [Mortierella sp. NVP85]